MKIKSDFITNSSSASYIIAVKKDFTIEDIKNELLKNDKGSLENYLNEYKTYWREYDEEDEYYDEDDSITKILKEKSPKKRLEVLAEELARDIFTNSRDGMKISDFLIFAYEGSSEDIELFSNWLYGYSSIDTDNIKIAGSYN